MFNLDSVLGNISFTKTEGKIVAILRDGGAHRWQELFECLPDELGPKVNLQMHISNIRKKLESTRLGIAVSENLGNTYYCMVTYVRSAYE